MLLKHSQEHCGLSLGGNSARREGENFSFGLGFGFAFLQGNHNPVKRQVLAWGRSRILTSVHWTGELARNSKPIYFLS